MFAGVKVLYYNILKFKTMKKLLFTCLFIIAHIACMYAQKHINPDYNLTKEGIAIKGYDPVAYFTANKAMKGDTANVTEFEGAIYCFANAANKATFLKSPSKYVPTYGGWCAYAMGESGQKANINPQSFKILNDKLYLFYKDTKTLWNSNEAALKTKADERWGNYTDKP
jgi:YHS domain-containing protein